jgi:hypothetical protein
LNKKEETPDNSLVNFDLAQFIKDQMNVVDEEEIDEAEEVEEEEPEIENPEEVEALSEAPEDEEE